MNALDVLFLINEREGKITKFLVEERKKFAKLHGVVNTWKAVDPSYDSSTIRKLHQRIKDNRRGISELLQIVRMDKKYG